MLLTLVEDIRREIGQHFVFGFHGHEVSNDIVTLIRQYYIGNIIIFKRNVQSIPQLHGLVQKLQNLAKESGHSQPLMIGIDQENGLTSAFSSIDAGTQFPGAMALAATSSLELAEQVSAASAREMRMAGINWAFSPVADVNSDRRNPVIGVRSFGDDPDAVGRFACAVSRGLTSAGVAPAAKHFPGHGDTHVDSHHGLPRIMKGHPALTTTELIPFRALIAPSGEPVASIMTGHMALPLVAGDDTPCTLSRAITTDLLRGELSFKGVVVTDCLEMDAVATEYGSEGGAVKALRAGADIVMICHRMDRQRGAVEAVYKAIADGSLSIDALRESGKRIQAFKARFAGTWNDGSVTADELDLAQLSSLKRENAQLSAQAHAASVAWIRGSQAFNPISPSDGLVLLFTPQMESLNPAVDDPEGLQRTSDGKLRNAAGPSYTAFATSVAKRAPSSRHIVYVPEAGAEIDADLSAAKAIIFTTRNADRATWQLDYLRRLLAENGSSGAQVVLVASCAPYDLVEADDIDVPCVCTFEFTAPALEAAAGVLFGETQASGQIPVELGKS